MGEPLELGRSWARRAATLATPRPMARRRMVCRGAHGALGAPETSVALGTRGEPEAGGLGAAGRAGIGSAAAGRADWVPWLIALVVFAAYAAISLSRYFQLAPGSWTWASSPSTSGSWRTCGPRW